MESALGNALAAGLTAEAFFSSTPYLTGLLVATVAKERRNIALYTAWHVEGFARTDRLPSLNDVLDHRPVPSRNATAEEMKTWLGGFRAKSAQ